MNIFEKLFSIAKPHRLVFLAEAPEPEPAPAVAPEAVEGRVNLPQADTEQVKARVDEAKKLLHAYTGNLPKDDPDYDYGELMNLLEGDLEDKLKRAPEADEIDLKPFVEEAITRAQEYIAEAKVDPAPAPAPAPEKAVDAFKDAPALAAEMPDKFDFKKGHVSGINNRAEFEAGLPRELASAILLDVVTPAVEKNETETPSAQGFDKLLRLAEVKVRKIKEELGEGIYASDNIKVTLSQDEKLAIAKAYLGDNSPIEKPEPATVDKPEPVAEKEPSLEDTINGLTLESLAKDSKDGIQAVIKAHPTYKTGDFAKTNPELAKAILGDRATAADTDKLIRKIQSLLGEKTPDGQAGQKTLNALTVKLGIEDRVGSGTAKVAREGEKSVERKGETPTNIVELKEADVPKELVGKLEANLMSLLTEANTQNDLTISQYKFFKNKDTGTITVALDVYLAGFTAPLIQVRTDGSKYLLMYRGKAVANTPMSEKTEATPAKLRGYIEQKLKEGRELIKKHSKRSTSTAENSNEIPFEATKYFEGLKVSLSDSMQVDAPVSEAVTEAKINPEVVAYFDQLRNGATDLVQIAEPEKADKGNYGAALLDGDGNKVGYIKIPGGDMSVSNAHVYEYNEQGKLVEIDRGSFKGKLEALNAKAEALAQARDKVESDRIAATEASPSIFDKAINFVKNKNPLDKAVDSVVDTVGKL